MRQTSGCEIERAMRGAGGRRARMLAAAWVAWVSLVSTSPASDTRRDAPGRPDSGYGLAGFLVTDMAEDAEATDEIVDPMSLPSATAALSTAAPAAPGIQQPGFIAPLGAATAVPLASGALQQQRFSIAGPANASGPSAASPLNPVAPSQGQVNQVQANQPPTIGLRSLWQSLLGTNTRMQRTTATNMRRGQRPTQIPIPPSDAAAGGMGKVGGIARTLYGQIAGNPQIASYPAAANQASATQPATQYAAGTRANDEQVAAEATATNPVAARRVISWPPTRLPATRAAAAGTDPQAVVSDSRESSAARPAGEMPSTVMATVAEPAVGGTGNQINRNHAEAIAARPAAATASAPYAVTSAPASLYPPGAIPPPDVIGQLSSAITGSTQEGGTVAGLWRPLRMAKNESGTPQPGNPMSPSMMATTTSPTTASGGIIPAGSASASGGDLGVASLLLQPFEQTNGGPVATREPGAAPASGATGGEHETVASAIRSTALFHQLSMSATGEPYSPPASEAEASESPLFRTEGELAATTASTSNPIVQTAATEERDGKSKRELVALMQELAPEPADVDVDTGELTPEAAEDEDKKEAKGAGGAAGDAKTLEDAEKLGEKPEDRTLEFLRTETVLLKPGESQCDVGISYVFSENEFPILLADVDGNIVSVDDVRFIVRELTVPMEYRVGLHKRVQGFINMPVGWSNTHIQFASTEDFRNDGGIGDLTFGLTAQLVDAAVDCPYVIGTLSGTAPTGGDPFTGVVGVSPSVPSLGDGFWSIQGNLLFVQQYDPIVVFYGLGIQGSFERRFNDIELRPGCEYSYLLGVGFAVNERITLSTRFFGSYIEEFEANGERILGSNIEPMSIRLAATISKPCDRLVEPFVEFGITPESTNAALGITWTY